MKKLLLVYAATLTFSVISACKSGNTTISDNDSDTCFKEAEVISIATFGPDDTPESIDKAIKAADLPMHIDWDCNGNGWLVPHYKGLLSIQIADSCRYVCEVAQIIFDDEPWLRITYTEDITGQYWLWMIPKNECSGIYITDLFDQQAEPYQFSSHGIKTHTGTGDYEAIVVRYTESGTFDTVPLVRAKDVE